MNQDNLLGDYSVSLHTSVKTGVFKISIICTEHLKHAVFQNVSLVVYLKNLVPVYVYGISGHIFNVLYG